MTSATYDTRFFVEHYYSSDPEVTNSTTREIRREKDKAISSVVVHEVYRLTHIPMADSIIAATASALRAVCVTDDPHISKIRELKTRWIV